MNIFRRFTCRSLGKNRTRTIVTIIGIILSVAMITAVTTTISSLQAFMVKVVQEQDGSWHGIFPGITVEQGQELSGKGEVEKTGALANIAYAKLENCQNKFKPFLYVAAAEGDFANLLSVHLLDGKMPQNSSEIILPKSLQDNGGVQYKTGDTVTLDTGVRKAKNGDLLWQYDSYGREDSKEETFESQGKKSYTVVGIYTSATLETGMSSGFTALTKADASTKLQGETLYLTLKDGSKIGQFIKNNIENPKKADTNSMFLAYTGESPNDQIQKLMNGLMVILIGIIMFGSIALIYNSFSISVNERKKQYGLLSSIGATKKQLKKSVMFESVLLSVIGIPLGVLAGLGGMAVTFYCTQDLFQPFFGEHASESIQLELSASLMSIVIAAIVGFLTVLISAYLPARKALKISAIEAIRQSADIKVKPGKLKTSRITTKLFGLEGMMASKNFKRNKRKYRATVFSLFISIVLFVSASSFCDYMGSSLTQVIEYYDSDLSYVTSQKDAGTQIYPQLVKADGVKDSSYNYASGFQLAVDRDLFSKEGIKQVETENEGQDGERFVQVLTTFVDDANYEKYLKENGLDSSIYMNAEHPTAVAIDTINKYDESIGKYNLYRMLNTTQGFQGKMLKEKELKDGYQLTYVNKTDQDGNVLCEIIQNKKDADGELQEVEGTSKFIALKDAYTITNVNIGTVTEQVPYGIDAYVGNAVVLMYPQSAMAKLCPEQKDFDLYMFFNSTEPSKTYQKMCTILQQNNLSTDSMTNVDEMIQSSKALVTLINVFSYGFIILISLIAIANVFNTISTNISLRRREFAMLRSVGMTQKSFYKMMNYECLLYGIKGILYGVPVAIGVTYLIYTSLGAGISQGFYIPWYSIVIAVGSVFVVVFATMLYSMNKIRKDNVVETLKNENY